MYNFLKMKPRRLDPKFINKHIGQKHYPHQDFNSMIKIFDTSINKYILDLKNKAYRIIQYLHDNKIELDDIDLDYIYRINDMFKKSFFDLEPMSIDVQHSIYPIVRHIYYLLKYPKSINERNSIFIELHNKLMSLLTNNSYRQLLLKILAQNPKDFTNKHIALNKDIIAIYGIGIALDLVLECLSKEDLETYLNMIGYTNIDLLKYRGSINIYQSLISDTLKDEMDNNEVSDKIDDVLDDIVYTSYNIFFCQSVNKEYNRKIYMAIQNTIKNSKKDIGYVHDVLLTNFHNMLNLNHNLFSSISYSIVENLDLFIHVEPCSVVMDDFVSIDFLVFLNDILTSDIFKHVDFEKMAKNIQYSKQDHSELANIIHAISAKNSTQGSIVNIINHLNELFISEDNRYCYLKDAMISFMNLYPEYLDSMVKDGIVFSVPEELHNPIHYYTAMIVHKDYKKVIIDRVGTFITVPS